MIHYGKCMLIARSAPLGWLAPIGFIRISPKKTADSDVMVEPVVHGVSGTSSGGHDTLGASWGASSFPLSIPPVKAKLLP